MTTNNMQKQDKLAVFFPGIGYTCDRSLLYYTAVLMKELGYEVVPVAYTGFPENVKGDAQKMRECYSIAQDRAAEILRDINFSDYDDIVFVGKSIGTVVALTIANQFDLTVRSVLYTPLLETFDLLPMGTGTNTSAVVFHGTSDQWARTPQIIAACDNHDVPLYLVGKANHSLETGDLNDDLRILKKTMQTVRGFLTMDRELYNSEMHVNTYGNYYDDEEDMYDDTDDLFDVDPSERDYYDDEALEMEETLDDFLIANDENPFDPDARFDAMSDPFGFGDDD